LDRQIELENQIKVLKIEREQVKTEKEKLYVETINKGLSQEQVWSVLTPLLAYIGVEGFADIKER
jgi:hypothetical protein